MIKISLTAVKGLIFFLVLVFASYRDIKTRTIPDAVHILIILAGLINFNPLQSLVGLILVPLPFLIAAMKFDGIGGGDIKLMATSGFLLGVYGGYIASFTGLLTAVIANFTYYKLKHIDKKVPFPLAPYLSLGCFIAFLIR